MASNAALVEAEILRKRGCAAAATATPTGGCTHGLLSCVCRVAPKGAARRALRGCSGGGLHGAVPYPGITPGRGGMYLFGWVGSQRGGGVALEGARNTCAHRSAPFGAGWVFWDRVFACARGCRAAAP